MINQETSNPILTAEQMQNVAAFERVLNNLEKEIRIHEEKLVPLKADEARLENYKTYMEEIVGKLEEKKAFLETKIEEIEKNSLEHQKNTEEAIKEHVRITGVQNDAQQKLEERTKELDTKEAKIVTDREELNIKNKEFEEKNAAFESKKQKLEEFLETL